MFSLSNQSLTPYLLQLDKSSEPNPYIIKYGIEFYDIPNYINDDNIDNAINHIKNGLITLDNKKKTAQGIFFLLCSYDHQILKNIPIEIIHYIIKIRNELPLDDEIRELAVQILKDRFNEYPLPEDICKIMCKMRNLRSLGKL